MTERLFEGADWDFSTLQRIHDACEEVARSELGLDIYPNQIEVITAEQMLDAYSSVGMPLFYKHWSFGKHFAHHEAFYRKGLRGLAYEIVINSSPCISYLMEENTATMQTLVIAPRGVRPQSFLQEQLPVQAMDRRRRHSRLSRFRQKLRGAMRGTSRPDGRRADARCRARPDVARGSIVIPARRSSIFAPKKSAPASAAARGERVQRSVADRSDRAAKSAATLSTERRRHLLGLPQENLLYFLEKAAPRLQPWQRELLRIVRHIAQYFYPQGQTKVMNEGTATYVHYRIMTRLHEQGRLSDGNFLEFLQSHTNVCSSPTSTIRAFRASIPMRSALR